MNSAWRCAEHGNVLPLSVFHRIDEAALHHVQKNAEVPLWLPDPAPQGWSMTGLATVGDERSRLRATVTAFGGPGPLGGDAEWLIVAEEPGIGLGATYAGTQDVPGRLTSSPPEAKVHALGHPTSMWLVPDALSDRCAYVGEADGVWLWIVGYPADAGYALVDELTLVDARVGAPAEVTANVKSGRLRPEHHSV